MATDYEPETWRVATEESAAEPVVVTAHTPLRFDSLRGAVELKQLRGGLEVIRLDAVVDAPTVIDVGDESRPGLGCMIVLGGRVGAELEGLDPLSAGQGDASFVLTPVDRTRLTFSAKGARLVSCCFPMDWFERLELPGNMLNGLLGAASGSPDHPFAFTFSNLQRLRRLGYELFSNPYTGTAAHLYLEAKLIELSALLLDELDRTKTGARPGPVRRSERDRLFEARDRLLADLARPPTLDELARATGLNRNKLLQGFRALFGTTPAQLLRDKRLELACTWLEEGRLSVSRIATLLGYSDPANFTHAFRARFGVPPSRWRR